MQEDNNPKPEQEEVKVTQVTNMMLFKWILCSFGIHTPKDSTIKFKEYTDRDRCCRLYKRWRLYE